MVIKKAQSVLEVNSTVAKIFDYPLGSDDVGFSYQELHGRIPESGVGKNNRCDEWYFVIDGTGEVTINGKSEVIEKGDLVVLTKQSKSFLIANNMKILTITKPNWSEDQYDELSS